MRAFRIAYDGRPYHGFQRQPSVPTVEDAIFDALRELGILGADADSPAGYAAAGRTDAGVSAIAQTIALEAPDWLTPRALSGRLPATVRAWASAEAGPDFHATHDATGRTYAYHLPAPPDVVDDGRLEAALAALSGRHDVADLTPDDRNTERTLELGADRDGDYLVVTVRAGGFSRELVRRLVSLARAVGTGDVGLERVERALGPEPLPDHERPPPAPPEPLVLTDVSYPDLSFAVDGEAAERARAVFEERRTEARTAARISRAIRDGIQ